MAIRRCSGGRLIRLSLLNRKSPSRTISPLSGATSPASMPTRVDLPLPETPKMPTRSPLTLKQVDRVKSLKLFLTVMESCTSSPPDQFSGHIFVQKYHEHRDDHRNQAE